MADRIGQTLGNYRLTRLLGQGGFAEVYLGVHLHLDTPAAIKLLHTLLATPGEIEKFRQEAQIIAALIHPHIVRVLDFGVEGGTPYLVLDYAPNGSLRQRLPSGAPHDPREVLPYLTQVAEGLQYAHDRKLIHRDIKPENMLLGRQQEVLLGDFGIAVVAQNTSLQKTEGVAGTTAYMAPEQLQGKPRPASDVYSLGVVVYEWLTGERPFQGSPMEVASQHVLAPLPPLREKVPAIPAAIEQVVVTALAKDPKDRFGNARAFANAFAQAVQASYSSATLSTLPGSAQSTGNQPAISPSSPGGNTIFGATTHITPLVTPQVPSSPGGDAIYGATTHITPLVTPGFSNPQMPAVQAAPSGPSVFDAQTHLTPPTAATSLAPGGSGSTPSWGGAGSGANVPPGWANQVPPAPVFPGGAPPAVAAISGPPSAGSPSVARDIGFGELDTFGGGQVPPVAIPGENEKARRKGGVSLWLLAVAAGLLVLAAIGGGGVFAFTHFSPGATTSGPTAPPTAASATVTITPQSNDLKDTFTIPGVTGTPDTSKQVQARQLSVTTQAQSETVNATGQGTTSGAHASGTVFVYNYDTANPLNLAAGTTFPNNQGSGAPSSLVIVLNVGVSLPPSPAFNGSGAPGVLVTAHVQQVGTFGNFGGAGCLLRSSSLSPRSLTTPSSGCNSGFLSYIGTCNNNQFNLCYDVGSQSAFTGGVDPQPYSVVAQSDIDGAANSLIQANQPDAQQVLQGQLRSGEQLIGTPQCSPNVSENHQAGDRANTVTVSVTFTCTGEAYDQNGALMLAKTLLTNEAQSKFGAAYALAGQIKVSQVNATQDQQGDVTITVNSEGIWAYQFSDTQKAQLAALIAGKSQADAMQVLMAQTGIARVAITLPSSMGHILPTDPQKITMVIQSVAGA